VNIRSPWVVSGIVVIAAVVLAYLLWPGPNLRTGSVKVKGTAEIAGTVPLAYRIVYRHEAGASVTTETLTVRRPFDARDETTQNGKQTALTINAFARYKTPQVTLAVPPAAAPQDMRPDVFLPGAVRDGRAQARERRRVAGRVCGVFRTAREGSTGTIPLLRAARGNYVDRCFDSSGLLLEEATFASGKLVDRRVAVRVDDHPAVTDTDFSVQGQTLDAGQGGGSVRQLTDDSRLPGSFWMVPQAPSGFAHMGRYAVVPPQSELTDFQHRSSIVATVDDVWVNGPDVLVLEQGGTLGGVQPFNTDPNATKVSSLGRLASGELTCSLRSCEIRALTGKGHFVVLQATLDATRLLALARSLVLEAGGTLTVR
jgi:hypothetical protein